MDPEFGSLFLSSFLSVLQIILLCAAGAVMARAVRRAPCSQNRFSIISLALQSFSFSLSPAPLSARPSSQGPSMPLPL